MTTEVELRPARGPTLPVVRGRTGGTVVCRAAMPTTTPAPPSPGADPEPGPVARLRAGLDWRAVAVATTLALLAAIGTVALLGGGDDGPDEVRLGLTPADEVDAGDPFAIELTTDDGGTTTLADELDGPAVVNFFASWCAPCVAEMPAFEAVSQALGEQVQVYGVAVTDRPEDARRIVEQTGISYGWSRDVRGDLAGAVGVVQMPTSFFVDADGEVVALHPGALDEDRLLELVEEHLGVTPEGSS